jgi:hypothetical protein
MRGGRRGSGIARLRRVSSAAAAKLNQRAAKAAGATQGNDDDDDKGAKCEESSDKRVTCQRHNMGHMSQGSSLRGVLLRFGGSNVVLFFTSV